MTVGFSSYCIVNLTVHFSLFDCRWYKKDENCFPALYILQPVTTCIPNYFNDNDQSLKQQAQKEWHIEYNIMREFLQQAAKEVFKDEDIWQKYARSGETNFLRKEFLVAITLYKIA